MRGSYQLREWEETHIKNMVAKALKDLKEYEIDDIDFTREDVNPYNIQQGLEMNGYEWSDTQDNRYDFWWYFIKYNEPKVCVFFDAQTFELKLSLCDYEEDI